MVHCPLTLRMRSLEHCTGCERYRGLKLEPEGATIECWLPAGASPRPPEGLREALEEVPVAELPTTQLECLDPELGAWEAARLMAAQQQLQAPVVDDRGVLLGMVSSRALAELPGWIEVEDVMSPPREKLLLTDSLYQALSLLARSGVAQVPVVTDEQELVGMVTAAQVVSWLERAIGSAGRQEPLVTVSEPQPPAAPGARESSPPAPRR